MLSLAAVAVLLFASRSPAQTLGDIGGLARRRAAIPPATVRATATRDMVARRGAVPGRALTSAEGTADAAEWERAAAAAEADPRHFGELLRAHQRDPERELPATDLGLAVQFAAIAADTFTYNVYVSAVPRELRGTMDDARDRLTKAAAAAAPAPPGDNLRVVADGNFRGLTNGGGEGAPVGTGSLALQAETGIGLWKAALAIASTQDTVADGFGTALLAPASGRALTSGLLDVHLLRVPIHLYASLARELWQVHDTPDVRAAGATVVGVGALFYHQVAAARVQDTDLALTLEGGLAARFLGGDILAEPDSTRLRVLSTTSRSFFGPELGMQLNVGKMAGALQLYYMPHRNDEHVNSFSGLQLVAGIGVTGDLFGTPLR